jgi:hypothetical protein
MNPFTANADTLAATGNAQRSVRQRIAENTPPAGCSKSSSSEAAGESKPEAYPQGYVEDFDKPRTKLADFINSLLD